MHTLFFRIIGTMMAFAAGFQVHFASELNDKCDVKLTTAPIIGATSLAASFIFNGIWVWAQRSNRAKIRRVAIFFWTVAVIVGTAAAGASLGQAELYTDLSCKASNTIGLHYLTIVLLILSISLPHAIQKRKQKKEDDSEEDSTAPLTRMTPLQFI